MKNLLFLMFIAGLIGCEEKKVTDPIIELEAKRYADSVVKSIMKNAMFDTIGLANSPVKVLEAEIVSSGSGSYRNIRLRYKNVSEKTIDAIRFRWYGETVFGDPADMGTIGLTDGFGSGFTDLPLFPGETDYGTWEMLSKDAKKVILAWPYEVVFSDGTKWKTSNQ